MTDNSHHCQVFHFDLYGTREEKYNYLNSHRLDTVAWQELTPQEPQYFFVPKDFGLQEEYERGFKVDELMLVNSSGVQSGRDDLFADYREEKLVKRIQHLLSGNVTQEFRDRYNVYNSSGYNLIQRISNTKYESSHTINISYRPFDQRIMYYDETLIKRAFYRVMQHLLKDNVALIVSRQCVEDWKYVFVSDKVCDMNYIASAGKLGGGYVFPLYLYQQNMGVEERIPNLNPEIVALLEKQLGETVLPQELFDYVYAVLHAPGYRERYREFLKIDFPRIPYPASAEEYHRLAGQGAALRRLHLMEDLPNATGVSFPQAGSMQVDCYRWEATSQRSEALPTTSQRSEALLTATGRVYINSEQYFDGVPEDAWLFYIGGYQPAQKWLKDRKGMTLSFDDVKHYQRIIYVLRETQRLMQEITIGG